MKNRQQISDNIFSKEKKKMPKFRCTVCGYEVEADEAPEQCPVCGVGADLFEEVKEDEE